MKFIIAPDKFKGSLTGLEFCNAVEEGIRLVYSNAEIVKMPMADGGDGTIEAIQYYLSGKKVLKIVKDPLFRNRKASYLYADETKIAFIEMAEASGLKLLSETEKNCTDSSSYGFGELIVDAIDNGANQIILGIGGSASNDGGMGMAEALGYSFLDVNRQKLSPIGRNLSKVTHIDTSNVHPRLKEVKFKVACDVSNPFYGKKGAAHIYAAQKGASQKEIELLDEGLESFSKIILKQFNIELQEVSGAGAAGGVGGGSFVFLNAELTPGIDLIKQIANFDAVIKDSDWIITGEGQLDAQTLSGKTISGVVSSAYSQNIPVAALCGSVQISAEIQNQLNLAYINSIVTGPITLEEAINTSYPNLVNASYNFAKLIATSKKHCLTST